MSFRKVLLYDEDVKPVLPVETPPIVEPEKKESEKSINIPTDVAVSDTIPIDDRFFQFIEDIVRRYLEKNSKKISKVQKKVNKPKKKNSKKSSKISKTKVKSQPKADKVLNWIYK